MDKPTDACRLLARLPNNRQGRAALKTLRAGWNREGYRLRVLFSGPREPHAYGTVKKNARVFRLYADRIGSSTAHYVWMEQALSAQRDLSLMTAACNDAREQYGELMGQYAVVSKAHDVSVAAARMWREHCEAHARNVNSLQSQLNSVPGWILWLVGFARDTRATLTRFLATYRSA